MKFKWPQLRKELLIGLLLLVATILAIVAANFFSSSYMDFLNYELGIAIGNYHFTKDMYLWINEGLMAIFFLYVGLELKRELVIGHLSKLNAVILPAVGALGGILFPVIIFCFINFGNSASLEGWAIPSATDIVFAIALLSLCSKHVPSWAKVFLLSLAIFDDLVAILIIAFFYTSSINYFALFLAVLLCIFLGLLNAYGIKKLSPYLLGSVILWVCVLKSGVHATIAGVVIAFLIPHGNKSQFLEKKLEPWITFLILPIFAFANTGINVSQLMEYGVTNSISLGSALGLFLGKQFGVFTFCLLSILIFGYKKPPGFSYRILYGLSVLCGIGFTMSIFIAALAYSDNNADLVLQARIGILLGSTASAVLGFLILRHEFNKQ